MSEVIDDEDGHTGNGTAVSDDDIRAMLATERSEKRALKAELDAERSGRNRAETGRYDAEEQAVAARLDNAEATALALRKAYSDALAEGRYDDAAEANDQMADLRAKQQADRQYKSWLAGEKARTARAAVPPADDGIDLAQYSPAQRKWIKANPEFMDDPKIRARTFAGHQLAVADGIAVDSPEYFEVIDATVNPRRRGEREADDAGPGRQNRDIDMPVTRRSAVTREGAKAVKLSADEMEAADITNSDTPVQGRKDSNGNWIPGRYERYAMQRERLRQQGRA
jgi:hypothetical protein